MNDLSSEQAPPPSDSAPINHHEKLSKVKNEVINHRNVSQSNDPLGRLETARDIKKKKKKKKKKKNKKTKIKKKNKKNKKLTSKKTTDTASI